MADQNRPLRRKKNITEGSVHVGKGSSGSSRPGGSIGGGSVGGGGRRNGGGRMSLPSLILVLALLFIFGGKDAVFDFLGSATSSTSGYSSGYSSNSSSSSGSSYGSNSGSSYGSNSGSSYGSNSGSSYGSSSSSNYGSSSNSSSSSGSSYGSNSGSGSSYPVSQLSGFGTMVNQASGQQGVLNQKVSATARAKRVSLKGNGKDTTTIMVYLCGTDLESRSGMATSDLQEMINAELSDKINILVYTGGCSQWKNRNFSTKKNQIYQVTSKGLSLLAENDRLLPMTDPATLAEFIKWSKKNYPADRYDLIFWDHGGGSASGYGYDEVYKNSGSMTLDKIGDALKAGGCTFDFIGFDACLMATLETALVCEPYADYLIASEETEPGIGWYYTNWLTKYSRDSSMQTISIGKNIVDDFVNTCAKNTPGQQATLSVIDLAEVAGDVPESFKAFAASTNEMIRGDSYKTVASARANTKEFARSSKIDQVDLIHLAKNIGSSEAKAFANVLTSAIKYNLTSRGVSNAYGISIYFPYGKMGTAGKILQTYEKIGLDPSYSDCVKSFASLEVGGQAYGGGYSGQMDSLFNSLFGTVSSGSGSTSGDLAAQLFTSLLSGRSLEQFDLDEENADFLDTALLEEKKEELAAGIIDQSQLIWQKKGTANVIPLSEDQWSNLSNIELNVFVDDGEGYIDLGLDNIYDFDEQGNLLGDYDNTWLTIDGQAVAYYLLSAEGTAADYTILGRVPARLNGERVELILSFTDENEDGVILGAKTVYDLSVTETDAKGLTPLQNGDRIQFLCNYYDYDRNFIDEYTLGSPITVKGEPQISNKLLDNDTCIAAYRLTDFYNNHYWTPAM